MVRSVRLVPFVGGASLILALALVLAACSGTPASAAPVTPVPPGVIALDAKEYSFTPATLTVPAGSATFSEALRDVSLAAVVGEAGAAG